MSTLKYILRHGWFWPFEFWLRPFAVQERIEANERKELYSALTGTSIISITIMLLLSFFGAPDRGTIEKGDIWIVYITAISITILLFSNISMYTKKNDYDINVYIFITAVSASFVLSGAFIFIFTGVGFGAVIGAGIGTFSSIFYAQYKSLNRTKETTYSVESLIAFTYILTFLTINSYKIQYHSFALYFILSLLIVNIILSLLTKQYKKSVAIFYIYIFILQLSLLLRVNEITNSESHLMALSISVIILFKTLFIQNKKFTEEKLHIITNNIEREQKHSIIASIAPFVILLFFSFFSTEKIQKNSLLIFSYIFFISFFGQGLLLYPLLRLLARLLYRPTRIQFHSTPSSTPLIGKWQSLALPLPGLQEYLAALVDSNIELGYATLKSVQTESYQGVVARNAAKMVLNSNKSLVFAGHLAVTTNKLTLAQLLVGPSVARSVAILSTPAQQELTENNILLSIYYPSKKEELDSNKSTVSPQLDNNTSLDDWVEMNKLSQEPLTVRLKAARSWLEEETQYEEKEQYVRLLILLQKATEGNLHHLAQYNIVTSNNNSWLNGGWEVVKRLQINCKGMFDDYLSLTFKEARKEYLRKQGEKTSGIDWLDLPWFWADIGQEIAEIWRKIYHQKENDIAELLYFNITLETKTIGTGNTNLSFQLSNTSGIIAKSVRIHLKKTIGIVWESNDINLVGLFQGHDSAKMNINLVIEQPGRYIINGTLTALDLDERSYEWPVNFVLHADEKGQPYQLSEKQYYIVGPRLSSDLLFVGRKQLLDDISLLWKEPANKEALLLIGLRRMGKSSLLEKIRRDGINDKVVPLLIDLQGKATQYAFFQAVAEAMAVELNCDAPVLEQNNPGPAFEQFLRSLTPQLAGRYILLMIDEANFFARRDYGELPHLLRSLMQAPDVPLLLLFCGTYELRQGARDYDSILYNTTRTKNVSYFNPTESAEVLTRPVRDFLEYDPQALQLAFQLTHGHPLLLQALGDQLIQTFNDTVLAGKERSNYVTYGDMEQAGKQLSQKENPAFGNYWEDADTAQQKVLAVMAASLDETSRKRGSLEYLLAQAAELRIPLERREGFKALDQLTQEEQLTYADGGYSFMVALYRRWIFWYYPPERFRESL